MISPLSTASAAGPKYFVIESGAPNDIRGASYFQSILLYQARILSKHLQGQSTQLLSGPSAPVHQITPQLANSVTEYVSALEPFVYLKDGWDGEETRAPTAVGIWQAIFDSYRLIAIGLPTPKPKMLPDGTLGVYWRSGKQYATIDFESDGVHVWTITDGKKFNSGTWDAKAEVPEDFRSIGTTFTEGGKVLPLQAP